MSTTNEVKYENTTRDNFQKWKRNLDSALSKHPDRLLSVVQDKELATATRIKIKQQALALSEDANDLMDDTLAELDTAAYYIIVATIANKTTLKTIERKYADSCDAHAVYKYICSQWALGEGEITDVSESAPGDGVG